MPQHASALPKYIQISEMLIREIAAGRLPDGTKLPPERDMAASHNTAVGTLRKALADLETKGLLERVQGSGNYIRARADVPSVYAFFRLELLQGGGLPAAQVLSLDRMRAPDGMVFGTSNDAYRIRRLRTLDAEAIALEEIWLDAALCPQITAADLSESLYLFYREMLGLVITKVADHIGVGQTPDWTVPAFVPAVGQAVGYIERTSSDATGRTPEFSRTWFDYNKARYVSRMGKG